MTRALQISYCGLFLYRRVRLALERSYACCLIKVCVHVRCAADVLIHVRYLGRCSNYDGYNTCFCADICEDTFHLGLSDPPNTHPKLSNDSLIAWQAPMALKCAFTVLWTETVVKSEQREADPFQKYW